MVRFITKLNFALLLGHPILKDVVLFSCQTNDNITDVKIAIQVTKQLQEIGGAEKLKEREMMEESVGRRKTVRNINNIHQSNQKKQAPHSLEKAFKRRLSTLGEDNGKDMRHCVAL